MLRRDFLRSVAAALGVACVPLAVKAKDCYPYPTAKAIYEPVVQYRVMGYEMLCTAGDDIRIGDHLVCDQYNRVIPHLNDWTRPIVADAIESGNKGDLIRIRLA